MNKKYETKNYTAVRGSSSHGRSTIIIECPFCGTEVEAYIWSLAGCGKKCPGCGAVHGSWNITRKLIK